jgi:purine-cytosine permease-like protein
MPPATTQDRTFWWMVSALFLAVFPFFSLGLFVHTYCENRPIMLVLAGLGVATLYFLVRFWPLTLLRRVGTILAILLCLIEISFNLWFFVWATRVCAEQQRLH